MAVLLGRDGAEGADSPTGRAGDQLVVGGAQHGWTLNTDGFEVESVAEPGSGSRLRR